MEAALDIGADNCETDREFHTVTCSLENFITIREQLEKRYGAPVSAKMVWKPKNTVAVGEEQAKNLIKLIEALEDDDDVQEVFSNFEISEDLITRLSA